MNISSFRYGTKIIAIIGLQATLLFQFGCVSMNKRPKRLLRKAIAQNMVFDAIIVPGVPFNGNWDTTMKGRVLWSYYLYSKGIAKNIIYSGSAVYSPYYEAKIMGLYGRELGVDPNHIFADTLAEHSTENVYYSYLLAKQLGFKSIALATDPFQSGMLKRFTKKRFRTPIYHLPLVADTLMAFKTLPVQIDPTSSIPAPGFVSILEREKFWKRFKGTLGRNIPWKNYKGGKVDEL